MAKPKYKDATEKEEGLDAFIRKYIADSTGTPGDFGIPLVPVIDMPDRNEEFLARVTKYRNFLETYDIDFPKRIENAFDEIFHEAMSERHTIGERHVTACKSIAMQMEDDAKTNLQSRIQWKKPTIWMAVSGIVGVIIGVVLTQLLQILK